MLVFDLQLEDTDMPRSTEDEEGKVLLVCAITQTQLQSKIVELERRCAAKEAAIQKLIEVDIAELKAWQNKALGYCMAASSIAAFLAPKLEKLL